MLQNIFIILLLSYIDGIRTFDESLDYRDFKLNYVSPIKRANTLMSTLFKDLGQKEKVRIDLYYEVFCPHCINFDENQFGPLVESMGDYLDVHTYPYGNAKTIEEKGNISFLCQHGPPECYGNKLHACALDNLEHSKALLFNICLMNSTEGGGSDDKTADECGKNMNVDSKPIKLCAKGNRGTELLKYYGEENNGCVMSLYFTIILLVCTLDESWTENINSIETNDLNERDFAMRLLSNDYYLTQFKFIPIYSEKVDIKIYYECLCPDCIKFDVEQFSPVLETMNQYLEIHTYPYGNAKFIPIYSEKVDIKIYYECLCPDCIKFDVEQFSPVLETMNQYLEIHTYPYGNAKTIKKNGKIEFICQHGPAECYGNKLHVCAIDSLQHITALRFNLCLMNSTEGRGSDDKMADKCGQLMGCDSEAIKACARSNRGTELLLYYGEQSKMANFNYVPYVLINGKVYNTDGNKDFKDAVCAAFDNPPPPCTNKYLVDK
nr:uncharacterized protein LOC116779211 [Danaus plexippus plexippus]